MPKMIRQVPDIPLPRSGKIAETAGARCRNRRPVRNTEAHRKPGGAEPFHARAALKTRLDLQQCGALGMPVTELSPQLKPWVARTTGDLPSRASPFESLEFSSLSAEGRLVQSLRLSPPATLRRAFGSEQRRDDSLKVRAPGGGTPEAKGDTRRRVCPITSPREISSRHRG